MLLARRLFWGGTPSIRCALHVSSINGKAPLDLPASMEDFGANIACMRQEAVNSSAYEFYPIQIIQQSTNAPESAMAGMTQLRRALCTVFDAVHSEASPWKDVCNSLMESVWHDDLKGAHVSIR